MILLGNRCIKNMLKNLFKTLIAVLFCLPVCAATVNCSNSSSDAGTINSALAAGGSVTVNGPCSITSTLNQHVNGTSLLGGINATFTRTTNGATLLDLVGSNLTVNGINFQQGNVNANSALTNLTFTHNTIANLTNSGGVSPGLLTNGLHGGTVSFNNIDNVMTGGYSDLTLLYPTAPGPIDAECWSDFQGLDGTVVQFNRFTRCGNDGFHIQPNGSITSTAKINISYNYCAQTHRACFEIQDFVGATGLDMFANVAITANLPFYDTFAFSIASVGNNIRFVNNLGSLNTQYCQGGVASFLEEMIHPGLVQGNVNAQLPYNYYGAIGGGLAYPPQSPASCYTFVNGGSSAISPPFIAAGLGDGTTNPSNTITLESNIMCGNDQVTGKDTTDGTPHTSNIVDVAGHNFESTSACPMGANATSNVGAPAFVSPPTAFPSFGSGTWHVTEISALPIRNMQFVVDGTTVATQEIQDISSTFSSDRKWLYSTTYNTTGLASGTHTMQAIATDVLGVASTTSSTFTAGSGSSPAVSFSPTSVAFGSQTVSTASAPITVMLTNSGSATLTISGITFTGTNSADFSKTTTCGSSLTAGSSCNILITFTPGASGARSASLSVSDNAAGSPHTVALTGTGASVSSCPGSLFLNCDFTAGTANWSANLAPYGSWVVDSGGPSGAPAAHISATSSIPPGSNLELFQDDMTLTPGQTYRLTFKANINRAQSITVLAIQEVPPYASYGLVLNQIITAGTWTPTYSTTFTATGGAAGDTRITVQMNNAAMGDELMFTDFSLTPLSTPPLIINGVSNITHSTAQISVTSATVICGNGLCGAGGATGRLRSTIDPATCVGNTSGFVQPMEIGPTYSTESAPGFVLLMDIAGLAPSTTYNVCPELSFDGKVTWTSGATVQFTTLPLPADHPAPPIPPNGFDPSYPNTTGFATYTLATDCSDIGPAYTAAVARQATQGTIIYVPVGTVCGVPAGGGNFDFSLKPVDVQSWVPANVNTSTNQITLGGSPTLTAAQGIRFGMGYKAHDTYPVSTSCEFGQGLVTGQLYYVHTVSTGNVVTLYCNDQITPMTFSTQGVADGLGFYWVPANRTLQEIIVRSAASDTNLPPPGVEITPAWLPNMGLIQSQLTNLNVAGPGGAVVVMGDSDGNYEAMISHIRIGPGLEITHVDSPEAHTSSDPQPFHAMIYTYPFDDHIVFDRDLIHLLGTPNRNNAGFFWDGYNTAVIDSYFDNLTYYHSEYSGLAVTKTSSTTASVTSGIINMGQGNISVPAYTLSIAGSGTGEVFIGLDMTASNAFTVWTPTGMTATCTPACVNKTAGTANGSCNYSDGWQKNSSTDPTVGQIGCLNVSGSSISFVIYCADGNGTTNSACPWISQWATEGDSWMLASNGPGPYIFWGNYSSGAGLLWHSDDGGTVQHIRGDYNYYRNYFISPFKYMYNPGNLSANPLSDGLGYFVRQPIEWKSGRRILFKGNVCDGNWVEIEASAGCVLFTSVNGLGITDVDIQSNTFEHQPGIVSMAFVTAGSNFSMTPPVTRYRLNNNLAWDIGNPNFYAGRQANPPPGWVGEGPNATEDMIISNNTFVGNTGTNPAIFDAFDLNTEGISVTNNIFYINSANQGVFQDGAVPNFSPCSGLIGKLLADCKFTPNYTWSNNLMIGNGQTPAAVASAWAGTVNYYQTGSSNLFAVGWFNHQTPSTTPQNGDAGFLNYHLTSASPWKAGSSSVNDHSKDVGADINLLDSDQGKVTDNGVADNTRTTTGGTLGYVAPDSGVCYVDVSSTDPAVISSTTRFTDSGGNQARTLAITGRATKTIQYYHLMCSGNSERSQRFGQFITR